MNTYISKLNHAYSKHVVISRTCPQRRLVRLNVSAFQQKYYSTTKSNFDEENEGKIFKILQNVKDGILEPSEAEKLINAEHEYHQPTIPSSSSSKSSASKSSQDENSILTSFATLDYNRQSRTGFPEVVFGQGKTPPQIVTILDDFARHQITITETDNNNNNDDTTVPKAILATRVTRDMYDEISKLPFKYGTIQYHETANIISMIPNSSVSPNHNNEERQQQVQAFKKHVAVVTAGTTDLPIAEEASVTLESAGCNVVRVVDVGVAGLHRIITALPKLRHPNVGCIIVVAGMDGALPSVVGGLVDVPVIAVPTSIGYGVSLGGISAMLTMLNSCAPGVGVVNIDNGFGAAALAYKFLRSHQT